MNPVIRIPHTVEGVQPYLEYFPKDGTWCGIETSAAILDDDSGWEDLLDAFDTTLVSLHSLLPVNVSRYLAEAGEIARNALLDYTRLLLERAAAAGVEAASVDLGVERRGEQDPEAALRVRAGMLRSLMPLAEQLNIVTCVATRIPAPLGGSAEASPAAEVIRQVMHSHCRLSLNVYPDELAPDADPDTLLADLHPHVGIIRWHYEPSMGSLLSRDFIDRWGTALGARGYDGLIVCCPQLDDPFPFGKELVRLNRLFAS